MLWELIKAGSLPPQALAGMAMIWLAGIVGIILLWAIRNTDWRGED